MFITFLICSLLSIVPLHNQYNVEAHNENNIVEKLERKNIVYDASTYTITYNADDVDNNDDNIAHWLNVYNVLTENGYVGSSNGLSVSGSYDGATDFTLSIVYTEHQQSEGAGGAPGTNRYVIWFSNGSNNYISISLNHLNNDNIIPLYDFNELVVVGAVYYDLFSPPTMADEISIPMGEFVTILTAPIVGVATGVANGVSHMAESLFLASNQGTITGLSTFGGIMALFCGLGLAIHLTTRVYLWITSLGKD